MWGTPLSKDDIAQVFQEYCRGTIGALPWSEMPLAPEASSIRGQLARINKLGYLTINSQPAVDGVSSQDAVFGWGPANGYVYQKAYLEFFVSAQGVDALVAQIKQSHPTVTYYAVNRAGDLRTNTQSEGPNAVTWGVFPGQEIVQPTVVEATSFMAWKDEAFALWSEWHALYPANSPSAQHLHEIQDTWFLMNIVENNFKAPESVFELFDKAPVMNGKTQCGTLA
ncbi:hypothetical protein CAUPRSCDRAFT_12873 [Caulochytrium protostelioides]|nr:hypothetical protein CAUPRSCDRAFT_12873 [Caulochytrium protostelioides]